MDAENPTPAVIFDLDGVLVATEPLKASAHAAAVRQLGGEASPDWYGPVMGKAHEVVRRQFLDAGGIRPDPDEYSRIYRERYERLLETDLQPMPGVQALLEALTGKGLRRAVVTSSQRWMVDRVLSKLDLWSHLDLVITTDDVEHPKPAPDPYLLALEKLDLPARLAVVVEDSEVGVQSALTAGLRVIAIRHDLNRTHNLEGAEEVLNSLEDTEAIVPILTRLTAG
jgi:HAD superfamily hydrolase (TIGR01509 family)